jgi:hypothetical protein
MNDEKYIQHPERNRLVRAEKHGEDDGVKWQVNECEEFIGLLIFHVFQHDKQFPFGSSNGIHFVQKK